MRRRIHACHMRRRIHAVFEPQGMLLLHYVAFAKVASV
jgi:hypothetical protein